VAPQVRYAKNGDVQLAYQVLGTGPLELVWVTGFVWHLEIVWEEPAVQRFFERLGSFARVLIYDKREQGLSDRLGQPPTLEQGMDDLHAVLDAAGFEQPALFGVSEGGPMAALFAATYPERTRALALYGTYPRILSAPGYDGGVDRDVLEGFLSLVESQWGSPDLATVFAPSVAGDERFLAWWGRALRAGTSPRGARDLIRMYFDIDVRDILPAIEVPALVLHRTGDMVAPVAGGRAFAELIPGARFVELPGNDHLPMVGDIDALIDEVEEFLTGTHADREPDRVLATVLFTDIVGSTERAVQMGDRRWRDLLAAHDDLSKRVVGAYRGRYVKSTGDGVLASFDGPARAIRAACTMRSRARELGVELRAGLHTGECEVLGEDIGGLAVHIGARVGAKAGAGEVLVTRTVADLVAGSGLELEDRGVHELKGVPGEWGLLAVPD
jgi:pimeloyl-ACP methyl ester carboxylesterase